MDTVIIYSLLVLFVLGLAGFVWYITRQPVMTARDMIPAPIPPPTETETVRAGVATVLYAGALTCAAILLTRRTLKLARLLRGTEVTVRLPQRVAGHVPTVLAPLFATSAMKPTATGIGYAQTLLKIAAKAISIDFGTK